MRILQVTQSYYPFIERGGPVVKVRAMAQGLAHRGHSVTVLTANLGLRQAKYAGLFRKDRWGWRGEQNSVETIYLSTLASYRALTWNPAIFSYCREELKRFDIVHIFGFYDLMGPAAARASRRFGVPYVLEPMGMFRPIVRNIALKRMYRRVLGAAEVRGARRIVATSQQEQEELVEQGVPASQIVVRRNGIEMPEGVPAAGGFRGPHGIADDVKIILFLGRLVTKKSPELLLEAFASWQSKQAERAFPKKSQPKAMVVFAGPVETNGYRKELEGRTRRLGLDGRVLFTGPLYDDAKWSAYRDADLFVLPSQNENFGNAAAEAVVCGTPVLVTDRCGIAPLVDERAGIVVPYDREALAAALGRMLEDRDLLSRLRKGCIDVAATLSWDQPLDETEALYTSLARRIQ